MIKINFNLIDNNISFSSNGHANYKEEGKDLVCSAVSSIIIGALNALENSKSYEITIQKGNVKVIANNVNNHDKIVFNTMLIQLKTVEKEYPNYLKIEGSY